jgi:hypothetical protein
VRLHGEVMAKKRKPAARKAAKADDLPQRFDVWQMDCRQMSATVRAGERSVRPWMLVVVSSTEEEAVLAFELLEEAPEPRDLQEVFARAMEEPAGGDPHRPTSVQVRSQEYADALKASVEAAGVELEILENLERVDEVLAELSGQLPNFEQGLPGLLDVPGVTPDVAGSFFDAAATFFDLAPWKKVGERPIRVSCERFENGPWYAVLMGQGGMTCGLVLYDDRETLHRIQQGDISEQDNARITAALAVIFSGPEDMAEDDLAAATKHEWRIAGSEAYPVVYRMDPGLAVRPPQAWELELLDGCLRAIPEFVRKKTRRLAPLAISVPVVSGDLPLELAWDDD